ncbi:C10 family peptidase [Bacteroidales bacterium OttesenSCG-928-C03]|nr:C10 family peptidase [Bacteroidales bacterium OttesenSCG-928-C03]MDL2325936.1 C10 family peptidase [Bacteroidales bacterium OttesenSCG-928-A14]
MKKQVFPLVIAIILAPFFLSSQTFNPQTIVEFATMAFSQRNSSMEKSQNSVKSIEFIVENGDTLMSVVNFSPTGFVIMGANAKTRPVWAYSTESNFELEHAPAAPFTLIDEYKGVVINDIMKEEANPEVKAAWMELANSAKGSKGTPVVSPLITANWNQSKYYNQLSPIDNESPAGYDNRVPNGCVAVAMAMIMYYYRYPESGTGSNTNRTGYGNYTVNFSQQTYNYNAMTDVLNNYNYEVAKLIFHCATSVNMNYAADGSGAMSEDAAKAFKNNFKYSSDVSRKNKEQYDENTWKEMLMASLDLKRPLYYSGSSKGGHAFVCDGYDSDSLFHFNFGWGGYGNGYFVLSGSDDAVGGYNGGQAAIFDIYPRENYPAFCGGTTVLTAASGTIEDGSGSENYADNSYCTYIIAPENAAVFHVNVDYLKTEADKDKLSFWKNDPSSKQLVRTLSGEEKGTSFTVEADTLFITFETDEKNSDEGWRISYSVERDVARCSGYTMLSEHSGVRSDGSPNGEEYASNSECNITIRPNTAIYDFSSITLKFNYFDLSPEDELYIYQVETASPELLHIFNGSTPPPTKMTFPYQRVRVTFKSDNYLQANGFEFRWHTDAVSSLQDVAKEKIVIYPNPTSNYTTIVMPEDVDNAVVSMFDIAGKIVFTDNIASGNASYKLNTSNFPSGIYILKITDGKTIATEKLVIDR